MIDARRLQERLSVRVDGDIGSHILRALFALVGAPPSIAPELGLSASVHSGLTAFSRPV